MATAPVPRVPGRLVSLAGVPGDSFDDILKKLTLLLGNLGGFVFSCFVVALYAANNLTVATLAGTVYLSSVVLVYAWYAHTRRFEAAAVLFQVLLFLAVVVIHLGLGGFRSSGVVLIWMTACSIMAIVAGQRRLAIVWMLTFLALTAMFVWLEPVISGMGPPVPDGLSRLLFGLNFGFGLTWMIGACFYFMWLLDRARHRADHLLLNILPETIARRLKDSPGTIADRHQDVSVVFADLVGFTELSSEADPEQVVELLDSIVRELDGLAREHGLEKIKTIGDAYMAAGGLGGAPEDGCRSSAAFALEAVEAVARRSDWRSAPLRLRVGMHTGPVVAGVIGQDKFGYDIWGDTVNVASRMESTGIPGAVQVTETVRNKLEGVYSFVPQGLVAVKGKGDMSTYLMKPRPNAMESDTGPTPGRLDRAKA
jgi:adenylate cyclase